MTDVYELRITAMMNEAGTGNAWRVEHRFTDLPETATVEALKAEAEATYEALFGSAPEFSQIICERLTDHVPATRHREEAQSL